ncbi:MAG: hypothetical protein Q9159_003398 [Coniocarpon cinnabarinum]
MSLRLLSQVAAFWASSAAGYLTDDGEVVIPGASSYNGLNLVPQMGWDNWNAFGCSINESLVLNTAQTMVDYGLRDLGYNYVVIDDCWSEGRNSSGYLVANTQTFPHGMGYVADQLHSMGMKLGMYSSAGIYTCGKYPASLGYEQKDADFFASNGVDYLKYDNCYNQGQSGTAQISFNRYQVMSQALNNTGRPIVYSMCSWGQDQPWDWAYTIANADRMSGDIYDSFNRPDANCPCTTNPCSWPGFHCSVMNIIEKMSPITSRTQSGYFNDMDMLEIGNGGQDDNEYVTHFSMWAMLASPLIMGTDITQISPQNLAIYANPAVIAINQDPSASAGSRVWKYNCDMIDQYGNCDYQLWVRGLDNGDYALAMINNANGSLNMNASLSDVFYLNAHAGTATTPPQLKEAWDVYDLWANRMSNDDAAMLINGTSGGNSTTMATYNATQTSYADGIQANSSALFGAKIDTVQPGGTLTANVPRHSTAFYRLRPAGSPVDKRKVEL